MKRSRIPGIRSSRTLFVLPSIDDDAPEATKNALAIRNACATEGRCPTCGAVGEASIDPTQALLFHLTFRHEDWCPVVRDEDAA